MYTKLFEKILDSSIWLEPDSTLRLWITLLASMNEDGFCAFACEENLGRRARLKPSLLRRALETLASPDLRSADSEHEGRRIEKVPGGWMVLNAKKYAALATRMDYLTGTRERVRRHREAENSGTTRNTLEHLGTPQNNSAHLGTSNNITPLPSTPVTHSVTLLDVDVDVDKNLLSEASSDDSHSGELAPEMKLADLKRRDDTKIPVRRVFAYYREKIGKSAAYTLTPSREKQGLKRFSEAVKMAARLRPDLPLIELPEAAEKLMRYAVDRMVESDWHMGRDRKSNGKSYNDWDNLFRSAEQFQEWVEREQCQTTTA